MLKVIIDIVNTSIKFQANQMGFDSAQNNSVKSWLDFEKRSRRGNIMAAVGGGGGGGIWLPADMPDCR